MTRLAWGSIVLVSVLGCRSGHMREVTASSPPGSNEAKVIFTRPSTAAGTADHPRLFDGGTLIGLTETGCRIEYRCAPGPHLFFGLGPESSMAAVRAELAAGKTYLIQTDLTTGKEGFLNWKVVLALIPVLKTHPSWGRKELYAEMTHRELDQKNRQRLEAEEQKALEKVQAHFNGPGKDEVLTMSAGDGWVE